MTREQLIREMIQIELIYQTRQKLLKESDPGDNESQQSSKEIPTSSSSTSTNSTSTNSTNTNSTNTNSTNTNKKNEFPHKIGNSCKNNFITQNFENKNIDLSKKYNKTITELKVSEVDEKDLKDIWDTLAVWLSTKKNQATGLINATAANYIFGQVLKNQEKIMSTSNSDLKIFQIFESVFPLQSIPYRSNGDFDALITFLKDNKEKFFIQEIYRNKEKEQNQTYNSGKGEYLCVLLVDNAKSGDTTDLDVIVGNLQFDVKQTTEQSPVLTFTLSEKSGLKKPKNKFIESYQKLGDKIYSLVDEFQKLGVTKDLIDNIKNSKGYMGSDFRSSATYIDLPNMTSSGKKINPKKLNIGPPDYISFRDVVNAYTEALKLLRSNTYANITELKNLIDIAKNKNNQSRQSQTSNSSGIFQGLDCKLEKIQRIIPAQMDKNTSQEIKPASSREVWHLTCNQSFKIENIDAKIINFLNDTYFLDLKTYNQILEIVNNKDLGPKLKKSYEDDLIGPRTNDYSKSPIYDQKTHHLTESNGNLIKFLDCNKYNQKIKENITDPDFQKIFLIDEKYAPIHSFLKAASDITANNYKDDTEFKNLLNDLGIPKLFKDANSSITVANLKEIRLDLITIVKQVFNNQIILNVNQMKRINEIFENNKKTTSQLTGNPNKNTVIDNEYLVAEPLQQTAEDGEFIIDISYYRNMKKRHIDRLHSQDFKITKSSDPNLIKNSKSEQIKTIKNTVADVTVNLKDVISDKEMINKKLKDFELFNNLQPEVLEKIFSSSNSKNLPKINRLTHGTHSGAEETKQVSVFDVYDYSIDDTALKKIRSAINGSLSKISGNTKENNILQLFNELYNAADEIEKTAESYYITKNQVFIFKEDDNTNYSGVNYWGKIREDLQKANIDGFITNITHKDILCFADPEKYSSDSEKKSTETIAAATQQVEQNETNDIVNTDTEDEEEVEAAKNKSPEVSKEDQNVESPDIKSTRTIKSFINSVFYEILKLMLDTQATFR